MRSKERATVTIIFIILKLLCLSLLIVVGQRFYRECLLYKIQQQTEIPLLSKRKLALYRHKQHQKHLVVLLCVTTGLSLILFSLTGVTLIMGRQFREGKQLVYELQEDLRFVQEEQALLSKMQLYEYPEGGVLLDTVDWSNMMLQQSLSESHLQIEQEIAQKIAPFLGRTLVLLFVDQPMQEVMLSLASTIEELEDREKWEENVKRFLAELADTPQISQIHITLSIRESLEERVEWTYLQEEGEWSELDAKDNAEKENSRTEQTEAEQKGSVASYE